MCMCIQYAICKMIYSYPDWSFNALRERLRNESNQNNPGNPFQNEMGEYSEKWLNARKKKTILNFKHFRIFYEAACVNWCIYILAWSLSLCAFAPIMNILLLHKKNCFICSVLYCVYNIKKKKKEWNKAKGWRGVEKKGLKFTN